MRKPPETFPGLDLSASGITIPADTPPETLAAGWNSSAWKVGKQVIKVTSQATNFDQANALLAKMKEEHEVLADYLDEYMPDTTYFTAPLRDSDTAKVVTVQPFMPGTHLSDFLSQPRNPVDNLREFLGKSKQVFKNERLMPDIACVEDGFSVFKNSNILMDEDGIPQLVDTTFGKTQRSKSLGPLWTRFIYAGTVVADTRLKIERIS